MIILDAYAAVALLRNEPAAGEVRLLLETGDAALTTVGVVEVIDHLVRLAGAHPDDAALDLAQLRLARPVPLDEVTAVQAGLLRARHYHRRDRPVSLADCVVGATGRAAQAAVATADPHLLDTCSAEGVEVVVLPDSRGARWSPRST
ncbi:MAG: PIN domain-containing protein [Acidimicrobiales bacterium]